MLHDARKVPQDTHLQADLCIIGAGAVGITIAREMIATGLKVILLESGDLEMQAEVQSFNAGECVGLPYAAMETGRSRYFGGSTNCWGGWCRPFNSIDFEERDSIPHSGWPFGRETLDPYYERAAKVCSLESNEFDTEVCERDIAAPLGLQVLPIKDERVVTQISQLSREPRFSRAYQQDICSAKNVDCYLNANVLEIETAEPVREVTGVTVATLAGTQFRVTAKVYVMSTGGIENPRLLLASNKVQRAGLGNEYDLVGRYFMERPQIYSGEIILDDPTKFTTNLYDPQYTYFNSPIGAHLALSEEAQRAEKVVNFKTWIITVYKGEKARGGESLKKLYRAIRKTTLPDHFMDTSAGFWIENFSNLVLDFPNTTAVIMGRLFKPRWLIEKLEFANLVEPVPNPDSRVTLSREKDRIGMNRVCLDWRLTRLDKYSICRSHEIIDEAVRRSGIGRVENAMTDADDPVWPEDMEWGWHHMGTTRMHEDPKRGVVDRNCKMHSLANLYVGGSSVFPTGGNDLPTFTIVALALRLSDHLKEKFAVS